MLDHKGIEYIRKDVYDEVQARIKELEEIVNFYAEPNKGPQIINGKKHTLCPDICSEYVDGQYVAFGTTARNALGKESENSHAI